MKKVLFASIALLLTLALAGCGAGLDGGVAAPTPDGASGGSVDATAPAATPSPVDTAELAVSERDDDASYDEADAVRVSFSNDGATTQGEGVTVGEGYITIAAEGTYILSGSYTGCIIVEAADDAKLQLVLDGLDVTAPSGPALLIRSADKVFITLAGGSANTLCDGAQYAVSGDDANADGAVFSRADITINGEGKLSVTGAYKHGIVSKDDLVITGGEISVNSVASALCGKDCVKITGGVFTLEAGKAGIKSDNEDDEGRGYVYIEGGSFDIDAQGKGIAAYSALYITGGTLDIVSADDALHTNGAMTLSGGDMTLSTGDDGLHADGDVTIEGGSIDITESYEGIEGANIYITGGAISLIASDDGLNAAGGADSSGFNGFGGGRDAFMGSGDYSVNISGGTLIVNARGDGIDSNGTINISGGVTLVSGPTDSGNGALDYASSAFVTGGTLMAAGSTGMAEGFSADGSTQCSALLQASGAAGERVSLCAADGTIIASFVPAKAWQSIVVTSPDMALGNTYTLMLGGTAADADADGFASSGTLEGGAQAASYEQSELTVGEGFGNFGGFGGKPGGDARPNGGMPSGGERPGGDMSGGATPSM